MYEVTSVKIKTINWKNEKGDQSAMMADVGLDDVQMIHGVGLQTNSAGELYEIRMPQRKGSKPNQYFDVVSFHSIKLEQSIFDAVQKTYKSSATKK